MRLHSIVSSIENEIHNIIKNKYHHNYYVIGEGDTSAPLLIIGEAMGRQEEIEKRIFVGSSGKIVRNILDKYQIHRFFMINTMPIRPIDNSTPTQKEIELFAPLYYQIVSLKQFCYILALGKCALSMLKYLCIKKYIATYHPAYLIYQRYNQNIISKFESAFHQIASPKLKLKTTISYVVFSGKINRN